MNRESDHIFRACTAKIEIKRCNDELMLFKNLGVKVLIQDKYTYLVFIFLHNEFYCKGAIKGMLGRSEANYH